MRMGAVYPGGPRDPDLWASPTWSTPIRYSNPNLYLTTGATTPEGPGSRRVTEEDVEAAAKASVPAVPFYKDPKILTIAGVLYFVMLMRLARPPRRKRK